MQALECLRCGEHCQSVECDNCGLNQRRAEPVICEWCGDKVPKQDCSSHKYQKPSSGRWTTGYTCPGCQ